MSVAAVGEDALILVRLFDTMTGAWQQLPDLPTHAIPKAAGLKWTTDGRVVILTANALGVWRPGAAHLAVRRVRRRSSPAINSSFGEPARRLRVFACGDRTPDVGRAGLEHSC